MSGMSDEIPTCPICGAQLTISKAVSRHRYVDEHNPHLGVKFGGPPLRLDTCANGHVTTDGRLATRHDRAEYAERVRYFRPGDVDSPGCD